MKIQFILFLIIALLVTACSTTTGKSIETGADTFEIQTDRPGYISVFSLDENEKPLQTELTQRNGDYYWAKFNMYTRDGAPLPIQARWMKVGDSNVNYFQTIGIPEPNQIYVLNIQ